MFHKHTIKRVVIKLGLKSWYKTLNNCVREKLRKLNWLYKIEIIQISSGFFAMFYSIIFFLYFFIKINKSLSFIFLISFFIGLYLISSTERGIMNDSFEQRRKETFPL